MLLRLFAFSQAFRTIPHPKRLPKFSRIVYLYAVLHIRRSGFAVITPNACVFSDRVELGSQIRESRASAQLAMTQRLLLFNTQKRRENPPESATFSFQKCNFCDAKRQLWAPERATFATSKWHFHFFTLQKRIFNC